MNYLAVFLGGGVGSALRYATSVALNGRGFPYGTFAVNALGCFLIGLFGAAAAKFSWSESVRLLLTVGLCGGFTTFSTFSNESLALLKNGSYGLFALYSVGSFTLGLAATAFGWWVLGK